MEPRVKLQPDASFKLPIRETTDQGQLKGRNRGQNFSIRSGGHTVVLWCGGWLTGYTVILSCLRGSCCLSLFGKAERLMALSDHSPFIGWVARSRLLNESEWPLSMVFQNGSTGELPQMTRGHWGLIREQQTTRSTRSTAPMAPPRQTREHCTRSDRQ